MSFQVDPKAEPQPMGSLYPHQTLTSAHLGTKSKKDHDGAQPIARNFDQELRGREWLDVIGDGTNEEREQFNIAAEEAKGANVEELLKKRSEEKRAFMNKSEPDYSEESSIDNAELQQKSFEDVSESKIRPSEEKNAVRATKKEKPIDIQPIEQKADLKPMREKADLKDEEDETEDFEGDEEYEEDLGTTEGQHKPRRRGGKKHRANKRKSEDIATVTPVVDDTTPVKESQEAPLAADEAPAHSALRQENLTYAQVVVMGEEAQGSADQPELKSEEDQSTKDLPLKEQASEKVADIKEQAGKKVDNVKAKASEMYEGAAEKVADVKKEAGKKIDDVKEKINDDQTAGQYLKEKASELYQGAAQTMTDAKDAVADKVQSVKNQFSGTTDKPESSTSDKMAAKKEQKEEQASSMWNNATEKAGEIKDTIVEKAQNIKSSIASTASASGQKAADLAEGARSSIAAAVSSKPAAVVESEDNLDKKADKDKISPKVTETHDMTTKVQPRVTEPEEDNKELDRVTEYRATKLTITEPKDASPKITEFRTSNMKTTQPISSTTDEAAPIKDKQEEPEESPEKKSIPTKAADAVKGAASSIASAVMNVLTLGGSSNEPKEQPAEPKLDDDAARFSS